MDRLDRWVTTVNSTEGLNKQDYHFLCNRLSSHSCTSKLCLSKRRDYYALYKNRWNSQTLAKDTRESYKNSQIDALTFVYLTGRGKLNKCRKNLTFISIIKRNEIMRKDDRVFTFFWQRCKFFNIRKIVSFLQSWIRLIKQISVYFRKWYWNRKLG